jgi:hypothetical protein
MFVPDLFFQLKSTFVSEARTQPNGAPFKLLALAWLKKFW